MDALACCLPAGIDSKALLAENWVQKAAETAEAAAAAAFAAIPAFNPADPQYNELARRLSKSAAMHKVKELQRTVVQQEKQLQGLSGEAKEAKKAELEDSQQQLAEAQAALTELQASFEQDPLSLTPWMNALFALADSGVTTFDAGGAVSLAHPPPQVSLLELMAAPSAAAGGPAGLSTWLYRGTERVLGAFKRRYEVERGPGHVRVTTRLALSPFGGASPAELTAAAEGALEASRTAVLGPEAAAAGGLLDTLLLHWLDYEDLPSMIAVLLCLKRYLAPAGAADHQQAQEAGPDGLTPKLTALGLVHPTAAALTAALRAGVPISCISLPFNLLDTSARPLVDLAHSRGIRVFAAAPTAHGLISKAFLGTAAPDTATATAGSGGSIKGCDNLAAGLDMVERYGGWSRFQALLTALKALADSHDTSLQCVALAWLTQQGGEGGRVTPLLTAHWGGGGGSPAGGALKTEGSSSSSGAPWPLSFGLQHFRLDLPAVGKVAVAATSEDTAEPPSPPPAAAAAGEEAVAAAVEGGEGSPVANAADVGGEQAAAAPVAGVVSSKCVKAGSWVCQMSQLVSQEELAAALAGLMGSRAAAAATSAA